MVELILGVLLAQESSRPIPDEAALKDAEALVREIFKEDYAKKSLADQAALARKLLHQASRTKDDPPALYVLLREAHDRATQAGDVRGSLEALDQLSKAFQVDRLGMKQSAAGKLSRFAKTADELKLSVRVFLELADEAAQVDDLDAADRALDAALPLSRNAKDLPLVTRVEARRREIKELKAASDLLKKARETLTTTPEDPSANDAVGRYECFRRGNWKAGLPLLAKTGDPALKDLARRDLAAPEDAAARLSLADGWWDLAEKEQGLAKSSMRARAGWWYRHVLPGLTGLTRLRVEKKVAEAPLLGLSLPTDGLVVHWKFDEGSGSSVTDSSGSGHALALMGNPVWGQGKSGGGLDLDGVDDWGQASDTRALRELHKSSYTLSAWFKPARVPSGRGSDNDANHGILIKSGMHIGLVYTADGTVSLQHWFQSEKAVFAYSQGLLTPGTWHHVAGVLDLPEGAVKIYLDGRLERSNAVPAGVVPRDYGPTTWKIGVARPVSTDWGWRAPGAVDEVRMYSRALSSEEIRALAQEP